VGVHTGRQSNGAYSPHASCTILIARAVCRYLRVLDVIYASLIPQLSVSLAGTAKVRDDYYIVRSPHGLVVAETLERRTFTGSSTKQIVQCALDSATDTICMLLLLWVPHSCTVAPRIDLFRLVCNDPTRYIACSPNCVLSRCA
jgi:hypothetical protein